MVVQPIAGSSGGGASYKFTLNSNSAPDSTPTINGEPIEVDVPVYLEAGSINTLFAGESTLGFTADDGTKLPYNYASSLSVRAGSRPVILLFVMPNQNCSYG